MARGIETEEVRRRVLAKHSERVIRLRDEVDNFLKMIVAQREAAESEWMSGFGYKGDSVNLKVVEAMEALVRMLSTATTCKLKLEKAERDAAENMTPAQERAEIANIIKSWDMKVRYDFLTELGNWHRSYGQLSKDVGNSKPRPGSTRWGKKEEKVEESDADSTD